MMENKTKIDLKNKSIFIVILVFALCFSASLLASCEYSMPSESGGDVKSVYRQYIEKHPDYEGTEEQWLQDLLGDKLGGNAQAGKSVYELYKETYPNYEGTEEQWLKDLLEGKLSPENSETKMYTVPLLSEKPKYSLFMGGDHQFAKMHTENTNGKTLLVIKDSYANALLPLLTEDYETILVIDPRNYYGKVTDLISEYNVDDCLFINYVFTTTFSDFVGKLNEVK